MLEYNSRFVECVRSTSLLSFLLEGNTERNHDFEISGNPIPEKQKIRIHTSEIPLLSRGWGNLGNPDGGGSGDGSPSDLNFVGIFNFILSPEQTEVYAKIKTNCPDFSSWRGFICKGGTGGGAVDTKIFSRKYISFHFNSQ